MAVGKMTGGRVLLLLAALLCAAAAVAAAQKASDVNAFWSDYHPDKINWDLNAAHVLCAMWDADKPLTWRSKYEWTAFCGTVGPVGQAACGQCLNVTNTATGESVTVRIVDECGNPALDLDYTAFSKIDTDGQGDRNGHLTVDYEFVDCGDDIVTDDSITSM
ncbi:unnamed protein product [Urochloa decumbens]|uniref:Barwin domain-containing protein n=1 Tax=Urochloa decumbens TaxID=240449 RepID=A0ABC8X2W8_9POAL